MSEIYRQHRTTRRPRLRLCGIIAVALLETSCVHVNEKSSAYWGCVAGTFLRVAAENFGAHYLKDAMTLVRLFSSDALPGDAAATAYSGDTGCRPAADAEQPIAGRPSEDWSRLSADPTRFALEVAIVKHKRSGGQLSSQSLHDGDILTRSEGDALEIRLALNTDIYLYVYAVDSTAWIQRLYPDPARGFANPVGAGKIVRLPGDGRVYGLDEFAGKQEIWFLAARQPRHDLESLLERYPLDRQRPKPVVATRSGEAPYQRISRASVLRRGLVEIDADPAPPALDDGGDTARIMPQRMIADQGATEIAFTRWFIHR